MKGKKLRETATTHLAAGALLLVPSPTPSPIATAATTANTTIASTAQKTTFLSPQTRPPPPPP